MTWWMYVVIYVAGWYASSLVFTRWFPTRSCSYACAAKYVSGYKISGDHDEMCKKWRNEPMRPDDAMGMALFWPLWWLWTPTYNLLHWNYYRDPWTRSRRKAIRGLSDQELAELDKVLFNEKELES